MTDINRYAYVKPKARKSAQGRHLVMSKDGRPTSHTKAPGGSFFFQMAPRQNGTLNSGLEYYVPNLWKAESEADAKLPTHWAHTNVWQKDTITRQMELELKYNLPPNTLTNVRSGERSAKNANYLEKFLYRLEDQTNRIDLNTIKGELFYEAARASKLIANSPEEAMYDVDARFYISSVNEEENKKASTKRLLAEANAALTKLYSEHGPTEARKIAIVLKQISTQTNEDSVYNALYDYVNEKTKARVKNIRDFLDFTDMLSSSTKRAKLDAYFTLRELVNYNVLVERKGAFIWTDKADTSLETIGRTEEQALAFLIDKGNKPYVTELNQQLSRMKSLI